MTNVLLVFAGGGAGSVIRYLIGLLFRSMPLSLPAGTLFSNISACAIFAAVIYFDRQRLPDAQTNLLLLTGFCGGLSTFSTFGYETYLLLSTGQSGAALLNIAVSTTLALAMFHLAMR